MEIFVIDTDQYAGNFEREMCAYITGHTGDCGVGLDVVDTFPLVSGVKQVPDEDGTMRPCSVYPTPGWHNNGLGFHFKDEQAEEALLKFQESAIASERKYIAQEEGHRGKNLRTWTEQAIDDSIQRRLSRIKVVGQMKEVTRWPANMSVAIYFYDGTLTSEIITTLKDRAVSYVDQYDTSRYGRKEITIEGYRRVKEITTITEEKV